MANPQIMTAGELELPEVLSSEIIADTQQASVIQTMASQVALPGSGSSIRVITGDAQAQWVEEGGEKPVDKATLTNKIMTPHKLAVIELFTQELLEDDQALYAELSRRLPGALARKFDETIIAGTAPGSGFDVLSDAQEIDASKGFYKGGLAAMKAIAQARGNLTGFAITPTAEADILGETDANGRPLFISNVATEGAVGSILNRPVFKADVIDGDVAALAGDWTNARWGVVGGIKVKISDQATVNTSAGLVNLWQTNQVGILVEARYGFVVGDKNKFARLTIDGTAPEDGA